MTRFLTWVVEATLAGDEASLKESSVGVGVFDRPPDYNPKTDPVVRSEARRLRDKISRYYSGGGQNDSVRIHLPKGGYVALLDWSPEPEAAATATPPGEGAGIPTEAVSDAGSASRDEAPMRAGESVRRWPAYAVMLAAGLVAGVGLAGAWQYARHATGERHAPLVPRRVYPITSYAGRELNGAVSPDGSKVVFARSDASHDYDLYAVTRSDGSTQRLTISPERELHPSYSPDGRNIAFLRTSPSGIEVWIMDADGKRARRLTEIHWFEWFNWRTDPLLSSADPGPAWTPDGRALILSDVAGTQQGASLWELEIATGARRQISMPTHLAHDFCPAVSPDGRYVAFVRQVSASVSDLYVADRRSGTERRVTNEGQEMRGLTWMPDSETVVYSSNRTGVLQLWSKRIHDASAEPDAVSAPGDLLYDPMVSSDGRLLVYTNATVNLNLWRYRLDGSEPPRPLVTSSGKNKFPRISPDGRNIAWASDRTGGWEIWVADADGSHERQITWLAHRSSGRLLGTPRWSPDGRWIAFDGREKKHSAIYVVASAGGTPRLLEENTWEERNPVFSRDGRWIYFNSNRGGIVQIWKRPVDGGPALRITSRRAYDCIESPEGQALYFIPSAGEPGIWRASADGSGDERILLPTVPFYTRRQWDMAGSRLYFLAHDDQPRTLLRFEPSRFVLDSVTRLDHEAADGNSLAVSPDERWAVVSQPNVLESDVMAIELR